MSNQWFEISNTGWRRMNAGRPPYELVKELVQNILDEDFHNASINFGMNNGEFYLTIEDDVQGGISDSSLITTVFLTGKEESHLKRGRKGRGLKEFLSVCYEAEVETVGKTIYFLENGSRHEESNVRTVGTKITCKIREENWDEKAIKQIENYLRKIIMYNDCEFYVNNKRIEKRKSVRSFPYELETHVILDGVQTTVRKGTTISLYDKIKKEKGWIYEMGIPVCEIDIPFDVDIQQRIPMNDNRNDVPENYLNDVKKSILTNCIDILEKKDLISWGVGGLRRYYMPFDIQQKIVEKIIGDDPYNAVIKTKGKFDDKAKQRGKKIVNIDSMDYDLQYLFKNILKSSETFIVDLEKEHKPIICEPNEVEREFLNAHEKIIKGIGLEVELRIVEKERDSSGFLPTAFYTYEGKHVISYNRIVMSKIFSDPYREIAIDTLIHELGHIEESEHENMKYVNAVTKYGAKIARYFIKGEVVKKEVMKKEVKSSGVTVFDSVKEVLIRSSGTYLSLEEIYGKLNAQTDGAKAGIRGVLNRNCPSTFERHPEGGKYRVRY